ncbi:MAG: hypothetical protein ACYCSX_01670 [Acidimicrobiales bacterium]
MFPSRTGGPLSTDAVGRPFGQARRRRGDGDGALLGFANRTCDPHVLRHSVAMNLLQAGVDTAEARIFERTQRPAA